MLDFESKGEEFVCVVYSFTCIEVYRQRVSERLIHINVHGQTHVHRQTRILTYRQTHRQTERERQRERERERW